MAKVTDIKNTKIRVENEEHSKAIQKDAFDMGYAWDDGNSTFFSNRSFIFFDDGLEIMSCDAPQTFERDKAKEIFFYNGEFHDKPQDEIDLDVSGQLDKLLESIKDESEAKKEKIKSLEKGLEKLSALGYEYHQGEWLSKEEIEKQRKQKLLDRVSNILHANGFGHDQLMLKCLLSHGLLDLSRFEDSEGEL